MGRFVSSKEDYDVYSDFDLVKHKEKFVNYLEVMIGEDGDVHYAVPSHQEYAISESCRKLGITRDELCKMTPKEYYLDWMTWLLMQCGMVAVWNDRYMGKPNNRQKNALKKMKLYGVYRGAI